MFNLPSSVLRRGAFALLLLGACACAIADEDDPPTRVARLAYVAGNVSFQPGGTEDWVLAPLNRPMTTGDRLWSDQDGRAELQLDSAVVRAGSGTDVSFLELDDNVTQIQLSAGTLIVHLWRFPDNRTFEIDTPNLAFSILRPGTYRVSVDANAANTSIEARSGQGEVTGGGGAYEVRPGEMDVFSGTDQLLESEQALAGGDEFDAWSDARDARWARRASSEYVSPDVIGYEDLDDYGRWQQTPDYGYVWYPSRLPPQWAPYHVGHWSYIPPWGYTWVDDQPWGFAPFHYGRWVNYQGGWGWVPAPPPPPGPAVTYVQPVYAPALVAFMAVGAGVAWFALGPRDVFIPSYPVSRGYIDNVNVSNTRVNTTIINNVYNTVVINKTTTNVMYVNRSVPGAIAAASPQTLATAAPVASHPLTLDRAALASAPVKVIAPAVVPTRSAVLGGAQSARAKPPAVLASRAVVVRRPPPPPPPPIDRRLQAISSNGGRPLSLAQARQLAPAAAHPNVRVAPAATPVPRAPAPSTRPPNVPAAAATNARPPGNALPSPHPSAPATAHISQSAVHANELPPVPHPPSPSNANSALEREQLQEQERLRAQQEQERQRAQQQQETEHQRQAAQQAQQALELEHQRQTQALQQKQMEQQQALQKRQEEQRQEQQRRAQEALAKAPPANNRPAPPREQPPRKPNENEPRK